MSFAELMRHAADIRTKAIELAAREHAQKYATQGAGNVDRAVFEREFAFIEPLFEPFSRIPDPAAYDPLIAELNAAMGKLRTGSVDNTELTRDVQLVGVNLDRMTTDGGYLQDWTGAAAMAFKAGFLDRFKTVAGNQFTALSTLKGVLLAHREMWARTRTDIDRIAETTRNALDNAGGCGKNQWNFTFSVTSAVVALMGVGLTISTGGLGAVLPAIGAASSAGGAVQAGSTASGDSVGAIIGSMRKAVDDLTRYVRSVEEQDIGAKVELLNSAVAANRSVLVAARPALAGMSDRDIVGDAGMGRPG